MMAQQYKVQAGDNLSTIAQRYGVKQSDISGYSSGDPNKIRVGETLYIGGQAPAPVNTINAQNLGSQPYTVPPQVPNTTPMTLLGLAEATQKNIQSLQPKVDKDEKEIRSTYDSLGGMAKKHTGLYESEGVNTAQKELNEINNLMSAKELAHRRKVEKIQKENPTGQLSEGQRIAIEKADMEFASEWADLALVANAKQGNFTTLKSIVDAKIDAETSDLTTKLASLTYFYEKNEAKLTDAKKTLLQQEMNIVTNELQEKKERLAQLGNIQMEAAANGAPASVITAIGSSADITAGITAAGKYIGLYDRKSADSIIADRANNGGQGAGGFTKTQIANGAANAGVPIETFKAYDADTQNFFINGDIAGAKKSIDAAFSEDGASIEDVTAEINAMGLPAAGSQYLLNYAQGSAADNAPLTPEQTTQTLVGTLNTLKTSGYSRGEASEAVMNELSENGKATLPKAMKNSIEDAMVQVYGRTFWQKVLPFGR